MFLLEWLQTPGEHAFFFEGKVGSLEAILTVPPVLNHNYMALLGHPHSLQGGTMQNKVVTTMARAFKDLGIPSIRFNFRGVGASEGQYDAGLGESDDLLALRDHCAALLPTIQFYMAGFSFGSYVAYRAAAQTNSPLLTIAPAVTHNDYKEFKQPKIWTIIQGDLDEVIPLTAVLAFNESLDLPLPLIQIADTGHFFHGHLLILKEQIMQTIQQVILQCP